MRKLTTSAKLAEALLRAGVMQKPAPIGVEKGYHDQQGTPSGIGMSQIVDRLSVTQQSRSETIAFLYRSIKSEKKGAK